MSTTEFIRQHLDKSPAEIMALAKKQGIVIKSIKRVYSERSRQKALGKAVKPMSPGRKSTPHKKSGIKVSAFSSTVTLPKKPVGRPPKKVMTAPDVFTALIDTLSETITQRVLERIRSAL